MIHGCTIGLLVAGIALVAAVLIDDTAGPEPEPRSHPRPVVTREKMLKKYHSLKKELSMPAIDSTDSGVDDGSAEKKHQQHPQQLLLRPKPVEKPKTEEELSVPAIDSTDSGVDDGSAEKKHQQHPQQLLLRPKPVEKPKTKNQDPAVEQEDKDDGKHGDKLSVIDNPADGEQQVIENPSDGEQQAIDNPSDGEQQVIDNPSDEELTRIVLQMIRKSFREAKNKLVKEMETKKLAAAAPGKAEEQQPSVEADIERDHPAEAEDSAVTKLKEKNLPEDHH